MARIQRPGQQVTAAPPTRRVPGRNNRGGRPGHGPNNRNRHRGPGGGATTAPPPADPPGGGTGDTGTPPDLTPAETLTNWANTNQAAYLQQELNAMHGGMTPGTSYDTWMNESYIPSQIGAFQQYQNDTVNPDANFDEWVKKYQTVADQQFAYAHRPDTQRSLNPFEGGGSHWSWFD